MLYNFRMNELKIWLAIADCFRSRTVYDCSYRELPFYMLLDDVYTVDDGRVVVSGQIVTGVVRVDDTVRIGWNAIGKVHGIMVSEEFIEIEEGKVGEQVCILLDITDVSYIETGMGIYHAYMGSNLHIDWKRLIEVIKKEFGIVMLKKELSKHAYNIQSIICSI